MTSSYLRRSVGKVRGLSCWRPWPPAKPVIASDIDGYRAVLRHGFEGLLVPPESPARAGRRHCPACFSDPALREEMGRRAQARAQGYGWPIVARQLLDFYAETIERQQPRRLLPHTALPIMSNGA